MQRILITGASGFIGSFLVEAGLEKGYEVWAAVRPSSSRQYLQDPRIHFFDLNLADEKALAQSLKAQVENVGAFDHVIHAAGATKARNEAQFEAINTEGTLSLARQLLQTGALVEGGRFVFISSLSVVGPVREDDHEPIMEEDEPMPNTAYGRSKLKAERGLAAIEGLNYIILRPTGVYGPRERDYMMMIQSIAQHVDFAVGFSPQSLTFIYVADLVQAAYLALTKGKKGKAYFLTDGRSYHSEDFSRLIQKELGVKHVLCIKAPFWLLKIICRCNEILARYTGNLPTLNTDKYNILKQRNWQCNVSHAICELDYMPEYSLEKGVKETVRWYQQMYQK